MSQKTNPISLRLQNSNKHFDSCWYSDFFYGQVLRDEIHLRTYMEGLLFQAGRSKAFPSIQGQYKRYYTLLFFLDQRAERHKREFSLKLSREPTERVILPRIKFLHSKKKNYVSPWNSVLFPQVQDILCKERFSEEEKYKSLVQELAKQERSSFTHNSKQGYVYRYAIKDSFFKLLFLSGLDSTKFCNRKLTHSYDSIVNPGLKQNLFERVSAFTKGSSLLDNNAKAVRSAYPASQGRQSRRTNARVGSYIESKDSFGVSSILFALLRSIPYTQKPLIKGTASVSSTKQAFDEAELQLELGLQARSKTKNIVLLKTGVIKKLMHNIFSVEEGRENLFRNLIIAKYSQSIQNRLPFWFVKGLEDQVRTNNTPFILDEKFFKKYTTFTSVETVDKSELRNKSGKFVQQEWRTKSLGLARHTELFLNIYSGNFLYHTIHPIRAITPFQGVGFLLESIAYLLQRKSSFRKIKDDLFRELDQYHFIKGVRLSCAGRLGGRSKKAQKAKTQTAQWGETSLTVFCSRLAFASKGVNTTYGKVGVKLWVCYKS